MPFPTEPSHRRWTSKNLNTAAAGIGVVHSIEAIELRFMCLLKVLQRTLTCVDLPGNLDMPFQIPDKLVEFATHLLI